MMATIQNLAGAVTVAAVFAGASVASAVTYNLTTNTQPLGHKNGNWHWAYQPVDAEGEGAPFKLRPITGIPSNDQLDPFATGWVGTINVSENGAGVQKSNRQGSTGISAREELLFEMWYSVSAERLVLGLNGVNFSVSAPVIFLSLGDAGLRNFTLSTSDIQSLMVSTGTNQGYLDFANIPGLDGSAVVKELIVRETAFNTFAKFLTIRDTFSDTVIPEPVTAGLCFAGIGALVFGATRRRR